VERRRVLDPHVVVGVPLDAARERQHLLSIHLVPGEQSDPESIPMRSRSASTSGSEWHERVERRRENSSGCSLPIITRSAIADRAEQRDVRVDVGERSEQRAHVLVSMP
jgi:hypothetical protein